MESYKGDEWSLMGSVEFDLLLFGVQMSEISGIDFTNNQTSDYGFRVCVDIENREEKSSFMMAFK
jgi:hypothetical protein